MDGGLTLVNWSRCVQSVRVARALHRLLVAGALWSIFTSAHGALPVAVGDEPLPSLAPMLEQVQPAVVNISTESVVQIRENPLLRDPFFQRFFDLPQSQRRQRSSQSLGSGVVIDAERGYIITNHHVIDKANEITVKLHDGRTFTAQTIGTDPDSDIAVIRVPAEHLTAIKTGNSDELRVGDFVVAIGNPFGLSQTVTSGIVSGLGRSGLGIEGYEDFIQTDASINPGNSGGALVNLRGELVGVNTAILAPGGGNVGIGFAIPVNMARDLMDQLVEFGAVRRGRLGVYVQDLTPELAQAFGISTLRGAVIAQVIPGSAAETAGIREGDVVAAINGRPIKKASDLRNAVGLLRVGESLDLEVLRDGVTEFLRARISAPTIIQNTGQAISPRLDGALLRELDADAERYGVLVVEVENDSPAWRAGLRQSDLIVSVNRQPVRTIADVKQAVKRNQRALLLNVQRDDGVLFLVLR